MTKTKKNKVSKAMPQEALPGMADAVVPELEAAAVEYVDVRDRRMELTKAEVDRKDALLLLMKDKNIDAYDHAGIHIRLSLAANIKVRVQKGE
jgi:hypothetical protein